MANLIEAKDHIVIIVIIATFTSGAFIRLLSFLIKSRCKNIECCCIKCERDVVNQNNLGNTVLRDIEMPVQV